MPKLVFLSDTHNQLSKVTVPPCDILCISGDITMMGRIDELKKFNSDVGNLKKNGVNKVVCIGGNHDFGLRDMPEMIEHLLSNVDHYLEDSECTINGLRIYGSPWQPEFFDWCWNLPRGEKLKEKWDLIPRDGIHVLLTHGPPFGILDDTTRGERVGCQDLLEAVLQAKPVVHSFGHIHYAYGMVDRQGTTFINASTCDEQYRPINPPVVFDI